MFVSGRWFCSCVFICLSSCSARGEEQQREAGAVSSAPVVVSISTDRQTYAPDDVIELTLELRNNSDRPLVLDFATGQRYEITILRAQGETAWSWSAGRNFTQVLGQETVQPDQGLLYREQVMPELQTGTFRIVGRIVARDNALADTTVIVVR